MHTPKLDSSATAWASQFANKKPGGAGIIVNFFCAIIWVVLAVLTQKIGYVAVAIIWSFVVLLQFERRGFSILLQSNARDARKENA